LLITKITFFPDAQIFSTTQFEWDILANRLRELAFLNKGASITLRCPGFNAALTSAEIPIVLLTGSLDTKFSKIAQALAGQSAHVDARVVEGVGHNVVLEAPKALAATLQRVEETVRR